LSLALHIHALHQFLQGRRITVRIASIWNAPRSAATLERPITPPHFRQRMPQLPLLLAVNMVMRASGKAINVKIDKMVAGTISSRRVNSGSAFRFVMKSRLRCRKT
jgi:hypothetical protein